MGRRWRILLALLLVWGCTPRRAAEVPASIRDLPDHICRPDRHFSAFRELGSTGRIPGLWVYAENDHFFGPVVAAQMAEAYASTGGVVELVMTAGYGDDGHMLFSRGSVDLWWPRVAPFLGKLGLPTEVSHPRAAPKLDPPRALGRRGQVGFAEYLASEGLEKAFAAGTDGWGWAASRRTRADAADAALRRCSEHGKDCVVYAVGDAYAQ